LERQQRVPASLLFDAPDLAHHLGEALLAMASGADGSGAQEVGRASMA
jgi:hypothetical protein